MRCRGEEIARVVDILLRHGKNNPALVGPAGVAQDARSSRGVRPAPGDRRRPALAARNPDPGGGPRVAARRHDVSRRLRGAHSCDSSPRRAPSPDVVLFIDELHNLIGQGTALGVAMDAGNMLEAGAACAATSGSSARRPTTSTSAGSAAIPRSSGAFSACSCASCRPTRRSTSCKAASERLGTPSQRRHHREWRSARRSSSPIAMRPTAVRPGSRDRRRWTKRARTRTPSRTTLGPRAGLSSGDDARS